LPTVPAMTRSRETYHCTTCGCTALQWAGRCPNCAEWNTFTATATATASATNAAAGGPDAVPLCQIVGGDALPMATGIDEVDRVMGGGFVAGAVTLVFGPPGVGKSTLLFQVLAALAERGFSVLLASAEESLTQVSVRATRVGTVPEQLMVLAGNDVGAIEAAIIRRPPSLVVVDSVQTICDPELAGATGSLTQIRDCVDRLTRLAKSTGVPIVLVGHVTKDGDLAGPRTIEHMVDTVLSFDGDRHHALRMLTAVKHRFGPTGEVGIFEMRDDGLRAVPDPGQLLLGDRMAGIPGSVVVPVLQGRRPLLVEVQALLGPAAGGGSGASGANARPITLGVDASRVSLLLAVLGCRADVVNTGGQVFVAAVGGISISEPAVDLAVALSVASAALGRAVPADLVVFGELGLAGEVRAVPGADRRLAEATRAGFTRAIVPASTPVEHLAVAPGMEIQQVRTLVDALALSWSPKVFDDPLDAARLEICEDDTAGTMPPWSRLAASR
jgi:DNA repair protein RadA/Sms